MAKPLVERQPDQTDVIVHHEHWQNTGYRTWLREQWLQIKRHQPIADMPGETAEPYAGEALAFVNHGRWVTWCPAGCGNAVVVSQAEPVYICLSPSFLCPTPKVWYTVKFPRSKRAIERELLKRLSKRPPHATNRNWTPGETVEQLQAENRAQGIK